MRIAITGASGLIGTALAAHWRNAGHTVQEVVRGRDWDPDTRSVRAGLFDGIDAVVHLAGENIAARRWTKAHKHRIVQSRVNGTTAVSAAIASLRGQPPALLCASASGYYGDRADEVLDESSPPGRGFLAESCIAWERAADPARDAGARVVHLRTGVVLARQGGALERMLPVFRLGLGGRLGHGQQWMSWIALADVVATFDRALHDDGVVGPVNVVAPAPVRNAEFTRALARALHRPAFLSVPAVALRLLLGEMADALLLSSARIQPARLQSAGFRFVHPALESALREAIA